MARKKDQAPQLTPTQQLKALESRFAFVKPARVILTSIKAVPTRFVQLDHATRVWGWPIQRAAVIHGPSNEGKTALGLGLLASFVEAGGMADLVDAERTTTADWARQLVGDTADSPRFIARRPSSYEKCVDETRELHRAVRDARAAGELPAHASMLTLIDSLRKLVPEDILAKIKKEGASGAKGSVDGMGGRAAQIRAAMNAAWLDELVPLVDECMTAWIAIARESEDPEADMWDRKFGNDYKVQGGKAVVYDAALRCRVERDSWVTIPKPGESDKKQVVGERHKVTILKTKVGGKEDRATVAYFHTSNGVAYPFGFDRARDVLEIAERFGIVEVGDGVVWKKEKWRGREAFLTAIRGADGELETLEAEVRSRFEDKAPVEADEVASPTIEVRS